MSGLTLISVQEAAHRLGVRPSSIHKRVKRGSLHPVMKLPGRTGAILLNAAEVDALADTLAAKTAS